MTSSVNSTLHYYVYPIEKVHTSIVKFLSLGPQNHNVQQYSYADYHQLWVSSNMALSYYTQFLPNIMSITTAILPQFNLTILLLSMTTLA